MAGLLDGVLPWVYSQSDRLKRGVSGLLSDPVGTLEQTAGGLLDSHRAQQGLLSQAFANPDRPFQVTDQGAMQAAAMNMLQGPLGFAPAGITGQNIGMAKPKFHEAGSMPNRGQDYIRDSAEELRKSLEDKGFSVDLTHSGSIVGPSSYLRVSDPQTGRFIQKPFRISNHSKGVFGMDQVNHLSSPDDFSKVIDDALKMRGMGESTGQKLIRERGLKETEETIAYQTKVYQRALAKGDAPLSNSERNAVAWMRKNGLIE